MNFYHYYFILIAKNFFKFNIKSMIQKYKIKDKTNKK